jgi:hypothetical protein
MLSPYLIILFFLSKEADSRKKESVKQVSFGGLFVYFHLEQPSHDICEINQLAILTHRQ